MERLLLVGRAIDRVNAAVAVVAEYLVILAVLVSAGNAVVRYVFSWSSNALLEIQWQMFAGMVLLGAAYTLRMNGHVRVDLVYANVGHRGRLYIDIAGILLFLLPATGYMIYLAWPFFLQSWRQGEMSMNAGGLVLWPVKALLPLGFTLLLLQGLSELVKRVAALRGELEIDTSYEKPVQ